MGSLGFGEIILILVIGFLIFGPEKLPKILKNLGKTLGKIFEIKDNLQNSLYDIKNSVDPDDIKLEDNVNEKNEIKKIHKNNSKNKKNKNLKDPD